MINAKFSSDMLNMLKGTVGQKFLKYKCVKDAIPDSTYGNIRLYFSNNIIDLSNKEHFYSELDEDIACFSCALASAGSLFKPAVVADTEETMVDGTVLSVAVVGDEIVLNDGEIIIDFDSAVVFKTDAGDYMFARADWFSEVILIDHDESYDTIFPVTKVIESWENDGENQITVKRSQRNL